MHVCVSMVSGLLVTVHFSHVKQQAIRPCNSSALLEQPYCLLKARLFVEHHCNFLFDRSMMMLYLNCSNICYAKHVLEHHIVS